MKNEQNLKERAIGGAIWKFAEKLGMQMMQIVIQIVLARILLPEDYGIIGLLSIFINISDVFILQGFTTALIQKKDADELDYSSVFFANLTMSAVIYIIFYAISPAVAKFYNTPQLCRVMRVLSLNIIVGAFCAVHNRKNKKIISFKNVLMLGCAFLVCIYALRFVSNTKFFQDRGLLSLHFDKLSDLMNASNTQGRNEIWTLLLTAFNRQNIFTKIFGAAMNFNQIFGYSGLNEHNTYVKVLINTGYCGLVLFALLFFIAIKEINDTPDRKLSCYTLSVLMVFLIVGFSVPTILYTNCSWIPLFMIGGCISSAQENYNVEVVET